MIPEFLREINTVSLFLRLLLALILGGIVGFERAEHGQSAGLKTHIIVCLGAAMVMITSQFMSKQYGSIDMTRMGAQVISGIGFLGAGTIIINGDKIKGLTTAAGLWTTACMGLAIGIGYYEGAAALTVFVLITMMFLRSLAQWSKSKNAVMSFKLVIDNTDVIKEVTELLNSMKINISSIEILKLGSDGRMTIHIKAHSSSHVNCQKLVTEIISKKNIVSIEDIL